MPLRALLLSRDTSVVATLRRLLEDLSIQVDVFANAGSALEIARRQKYEALLLEVDDVEGARDLLAQVRNVPFNRNSILFGITHRRTSFRTAFEQGANFVLEKPLAPDRALRSVR